MEEEIGTELTLMGSSKVDGESPIVRAVVNDDEAERNERGEEIGDHSNEDDFEFTFEGVDRDSEWFPPGEVFPIFDQRLLSETEALAIDNDQMQIVRSALKKLFVVEDRDLNEDHTELDGVSPESYCVWTPGNSPQASPARCKKSSSTGTTTARRWGVSLRELLIRRSRSDGSKGLSVRFGSGKKSVIKRETTSDNEVVDVKKEKKKVVKGGGEKRRATYLPYKKAIIGFGYYPSVNGFGGVNRNRPPF